ncbi:MAG: hypothetical protein RL060_289 [Bacteroidota bacterium]|jgi:hypothetical protein
MKKYSVYFLLAMLAIGTISIMAFKPQDKKAFSSQGSYIMVEIYEFPTHQEKGIHIHYGNGKREFVPFKSFTLENHDDNGDITINTINKLVSEGYEIESTCSGLTDAGMLTKLFMRKR